MNKKQLINKILKKNKELNKHQDGWCSYKVLEGFTVKQLKEELFHIEWKLSEFIGIKKQQKKKERRHIQDENQNQSKGKSSKSLLQEKKLQEKH